MLRVYFGHHKCASRYITDIFLQATDILGMVPRQRYGLAAELPLDYNSHPEYQEQLALRTKILKSGRFQVLILTNADIESLALIAEGREYRGFHVVRDPRDIVVSAYFSHLYTHGAAEGSWWMEFRKKLAAAKDKEHGLMLELDFLHTFLNNMRKWDYNNPNVFESRYEIITKDPFNEFVKIFTFLGIQTPTVGIEDLFALYFGQRKAHRTGSPMPYRERLPKLLLKRILDRNSFENKSEGRQQGEENTHSHYRKGVSGDWQEHFSPAVKEEFKKRYNDLLVKLNYEQDENW